MRVLSLIKPEYLLRPAQIIRRLMALRHVSSETDLQLPWGMSIQGQGHDELLRSIRQSGIYDLCLTEALWRLTGEGNVCMDVGANIGYATSILLTRAGESGRVFSFEPHPKIFQELEENVQRWSKIPGFASSECLELALSDNCGSRQLNIPPDFEDNRGRAHFYEAEEKPECTGGEISVNCTTLDHFARSRDIETIDVLKVDAEGHEVPVLKGAQELLKQQRIRHILFEDSRASWRTPRGLCEDYQFLAEFGYEVFRLERRFTGLSVESLFALREDDTSVSKGWEPPNFVATPSPETTLALFKRRGWLSLSVG